MKNAAWITIACSLAACSHGTSPAPSAPSSTPVSSSAPGPVTAAATSTIAVPSPSTQPAPNACETNPAFSQFDFWVGDWEVFDADGNKQGENRISKVEGGCLVLEQWTSVRGTTGQSYNFYDPVTEKWRQVWVSLGMSIDYDGGLRKDGAMELVGEIHYHNGTSFPFRGQWSPLQDGSVRQHFEQFNPETRTWDAWFTGFYRRRP